MILENFVNTINHFDELSASAKIDYFTYFHTVSIQNDGIKAKDIENYFEELKLHKYSNISQYLSVNAKKIKGKTQKFILQKGVYHLERSLKAKIDLEINAPKAVIATGNYFPLEIFNNTRGYLEAFANQAAACYDNKLYDACSVMTRKLLEILIIEAFEKHNLSDKIKNKSGNFFFLSDLIDLFKAETAWNIGRNASAVLLNLKKIGDMSAHARRFIARKGDIEKVKEDLRIVLEELVLLNDYSKK